MLKTLLAVPHSVPLPSLRSELGCLSMEERIHQRKLTFLFHVKSLPLSSLANEIYEIQRSFHFPGLVQECRHLIKKYQLPDIIDEENDYSKLQWKNLVKKSIYKHSEDSLRKQMAEYSKLKDGPLMKEGLKMKPYVLNMKLRDARTMFRNRTRMLPVKMNMKSNEKFAKNSWKCDDCQRMDSQSHILWCPSYAPLRQNRDLEKDEDLVHFFQDVFKIREENENLEKNS